MREHADNPAGLFNRRESKVNNVFESDFRALDGAANHDCFWNSREMGVKFCWTSLALAAAQPPKSFSELALESEARHLTGSEEKEKKALEIDNKNNRPPPVSGALRSICNVLKQK